MQCERQQRDLYMNDACNNSKLILTHGVIETMDDVHWTRMQAINYLLLITWCSRSLVKISILTLIDLQCVY